MIRSIFSKILLSHIIVILVTTVTMGILMPFLIRNYLIESRKNELIQKGQSIVSFIGPSLETSRVTAHMESIGNLVGANVWIMDNSGKVLAGKAPERWQRRVAENPEEYQRLFGSDVQSWIRTGRKQADPSVAVSIPVPNASPPAALFLYTPIKGVTKAADAVEDLLLIALSVGTGAALTIGFLISRSLTKPIQNISNSADSFAKGNFEARAQVSGSDEVSRLGQTFNSMAEAIAGVEQNRRDFLANVSHELKTPVASIQVLAESLADGLVQDPDQQRRYLNNIVAETGRIDRLIRDLLDMSLLVAGQLPIRLSPVNLSEFVKDHIERHQHSLQARNLEVTIDSPPNLGKVLADPDRLEQVFTNLLSNAARYSPVGSKIKIILTPSSSAVVLSVADQGPGIPAPDLPFIFDRFYRVEKSRVRSDGGTGLGLAISKKLVTAMNGIISVRSIEGQGSTFTITLPIA